MKPKYQRLIRYIAYCAIMASGVFVILRATWSDLSFYRTPTEVITQNIKGKFTRLGGYVKKGSIKSEGKAIRFVVSDSHVEIPVMYSGPIPQLFREGQGVVLDGMLLDDGVFRASRVLAKHDEVYTSNKRTLEPKV